MSEDNQFAPTPIDPTVSKTDDEVLSHVRGVRLSILNEQVRQGVPVDKDSWAMMHQNMQELEKGAFTSKRLIQEDKNTENLAESSRLIAASIVSAMGGGRDVYANRNGVVGVIPDPLKDIEGTANIVDGELDVGNVEDTFDEFQNRVGRKFEEARRLAAAEVPTNE